jgi:LmbE family N-acetylglucosaminyl deacetylase
MVRAGRRSVLAGTVVAAVLLLAPGAIAAGPLHPQPVESVGPMSTPRESIGSASPRPATRAAGLVGRVVPTTGGRAVTPSPESRTVEPTPAEETGADLRTLNVVAHQDDDLLFMNPAVSDDIAAGRWVVTVFVTAGDAGRGSAYWRGREQGAMAAYAAMAGVPGKWAADTVNLAGHRIQRRSLAGTRVALLFLRLADGHGNKARPSENLRSLWRGQIPTVRPLDSTDRYTRTGLVRTLTSLMDLLQPDDIRTLDFAGDYGDGDHADHHTVGYFTYKAQRQYLSEHSTSGYLGYPAEFHPVNLSTEERDRKLAWFMAYAPFDLKVCQRAATCLSNFYAPRFARTVQITDDATIG